MHLGDEIKGMELLYNRYCYWQEQVDTYGFEHEYAKITYQHFSAALDFFSEMMNESDSDYYWYEITEKYRKEHDLVIS